MTSVWIGLLGVIVGGLITTLWSWLAVVRQELSDGMVAARMVDDNLASLAQGRQSPESDGGKPGDGLVWEQHRGALARVLGRQEWERVSTVYRNHNLLTPDDSLRKDIAAAQEALSGLVAGKRYVMGQRLRNLSAGTRTYR
jgi:hypothetical protein